MSQKDRALDEVRKLIFSRALPPGEILSERQLTEDYLPRANLGRTPVREALMILAEQGVIDQYPQVGFAVRVVDADAADKALRLQEITEGYIVADAASAGLDTAELLRTAGRMRTAATTGDGAGFLDLSRSYHAHVAQAMGYEEAAYAIQGFRDRYALYLANTRLPNDNELVQAVAAYLQLTNTIRTEHDPSRNHTCLHELIDLERGYVATRSGAQMGTPLVPA